MKYNYKASVSVVEAPEKNGSSLGKATITHNFSSVEKVSAIEKNSCDKGKTWRDMRGESISKTESSATGKEDASVTVGVNADGTYTVSVGIPPIKGETKGSQTSSYSGQCVPKEGKNLTMQPTATSGRRQFADERRNAPRRPDDPNRLSGSFRIVSKCHGNDLWNLQKCGGELQLIALEFEDMKFPNWNDWRKVEETKGTIDGNLVKIKARVLNASPETKFADIKFKETFKGDKWDGCAPRRTFGKRRSLGPARCG